jgi:FkbM family methyltransferase
VNAVLGRTGLELRARQKEDPRATLKGVLAQCAGMGFAPRTVFDVGVGVGTLDLYEGFPQAHHVLVEPLREFEGVLRRVAEVYDAEYVLAAAADHEGTITINVHTDNLDSSSLMRESEGPHVDGTPREVPATTIDSLVNTRGLRGPFLLKVDVQGAELAVIRGAANTLADTELVLLEVSLFGVFDGGPQFYDVVQFMKERGFATYDICGGIYRPLDKALWQLDMAFVKNHGIFRRSQDYATREQRSRLDRELTGVAAKVEAELAARRRS